MLKTAIPVIHVSDSRRAEEFYCKGLGFDLLSSWRPHETNHDPCYMTLARDGARLHVTSFKDGVVGTWTSNVYVFVEDVDALHSEFLAKGISMVHPPVDQTWGTREIGVRVPRSKRHLLWTAAHHATAKLTHLPTPPFTARG